MSSTITLGKVQMIIKGTYDSTTTYDVLDIVEYEGSSYICKQACTGADITNTTYWQLLAEKGEQGEQGEQGVQGIQGETGSKGDTGDTGNGIESIEKTATVDLVDTYTITYTDGTTTTFDVTNGSGINEWTQTQGDTVISSGTTLTNGYEVTIPVSYVVGSNSLEVYYNGWRLIPKTSDNDDGHYTEVGDSGAEGTTIAFYRTDEDGDYTLTEDAHLHVVVKGKNTVEDTGTATALSLDNEDTETEAEIEVASEDSDSSEEVVADET